MRTALTRWPEHDARELAPRTREVWAPGITYTSHVSRRVRVWLLLWQQPVREQVMWYRIALVVRHRTATRASQSLFRCDIGQADPATNRPSILPYTHDQRESVHAVEQARLHGAFVVSRICISSANCSLFLSLSSPSPPSSHLPPLLLPRHVHRTIPVRYPSSTSLPPHHPFPMTIFYCFFYCCSYFSSFCRYFVLHLFGQQPITSFESEHPVLDYA